MSQYLHDIKVNPSNPLQGYTLSTFGTITAFGGAVPPPASGDAQAVKDAGNGAYAWTSGNVPTFPRTLIGPCRAFEVVDWVTPSGYTMTWDGEVWPWGPNADMPVGQVSDEVGYVNDAGWHDLVMNPAGNGQGYVLHYDGAMVAIGGAPGVPTTFITTPGQAPGSNYARRLEMQWSSKKYIIITSWGQIFAMNGAPTITSMDYPATGSGTGLTNGQINFPNVEMMQDFKIYDWATGKGWALDWWGIIRALNGTPSFPYENIIKSIESKWMALAIVSSVLPAKVICLSNIGERILVATSSAPTGVVTGPAPASTVTVTTRPGISWAYNSVSGEGQRSAKIRVFSAAQFGIGGFDPAVSPASWETILVSPNVSSVDPNIDFGNGVWRAYVQVVSTSGLVSAWAYSQWDQAVTLINTPTLAVTYSGTLDDGVTLHASILSPGTAVMGFQYQDADLLIWRWVRGGLGIVPVGAGSTKIATVIDIEARSGVVRSYRAVAYTGDVSITASFYSNIVTAEITEAGWVLSGMTSGLQKRVKVAPPFEYKRSQLGGVFYPAGNGVDVPMPIVVSDGTPRSAEFTATFRTLSRADFEDLMSILMTEEVMLLRDSFGNAWFVKIAPGAGPSFQRLMASPTEFETTPFRHAHEIPVPFIEVRRPISGPTSGSLALLN